jgi:hypothetical protein
MQILCEVNQAECFRRGIDAPKSTIKLEVTPAKLPEDLRAFVADNLYDGYKLSLFEGIPGTDLVALMEAILANQEFKKANPNEWLSDFGTWIKGDGKEMAGQRLEKAKELAEAQGGDVLSGDAKKQKVAQAALSKSEESKSDKETREEQHEKRMNEQYEKRMNEQEKLGPEKPLGSRK